MPTTNPVPSSNPTDLLFNAEKLDEVINGGGPTFEDRLGVTRLTVAGAVASIATFVSRSAWVTVTAYVLKDLVQQSGTWYVCLVPHTSGVFDTDLAAGKWAVYQGLTSADLGYGAAADVKSFLDAITSFNTHCLHAAHEKFRLLEAAASGAPYYVGITGYGDSMANESYTPGVMVRALQLRYGLGGLFTPGLGQSWNGAAWTLAGGAAQPRTDYTYFPGANQITMPSGSTASTTAGSLKRGSSDVTAGAFPLESQHYDLSLTETGFFKKVRFFYLTRPDDGTLTFTVSQTGVTGYSPSVNSCNAALGLSYVDVTVLDPTRGVSISIEATVAGCVFVGAVFLRETGVLFWNSQVGGSSMASQNAYIANDNYSGVYASLCSALSTALFIHAQRASGDEAYQANYAQVFTALDTITGTNQLVLGEPPSNPDGTPTVAAINTYLRDQCLSRGYCFIDQNKMLGSSSALLTTLGWNDGDGIHLDPPAHRYLAGKILAALDWFRLGENKLDIDPLTMGQYLRRRMKLMALQGLLSHTISGRAGFTVDGAATSGGYTNSVSNERGFIMTGAAALGAAACRPGVVPMSVNVKTDRADLAVVFSGYRNLALVAGARGFGLVGVTSTFSSLSALNQRCFGFEVARGADVGSPGGVTTEVVRLLASTGAAITYGNWADCKASGDLGTSQGGLNIAIVWNTLTGKLELYRASAASFYCIGELAATDLLTNPCAGQYVNVCLVAEDAGNVPPSAAAMSFLEIKSFWGDPEAMFGGMARNDLIGSRT